MRYNALRYFKTEKEAKEFAMSVGSESWGYEIDCETGKIAKWYVDYNI